MDEVQQAQRKGREWKAEAATKVAGQIGQGQNDRQHSPEQDKKAREDQEAPDAVWLHGTLKVHVRPPPVAP